MSGALCARFDVLLRGDQDVGHASLHWCAPRAPRASALTRRRASASVYCGNGYKSLLVLSYAHTTPPRSVAFVLDERCAPTDDVVRLPSDCATLALVSCRHSLFSAAIALHVAPSGISCLDGAQCTPLWRVPSDLRRIDIVAADGHTVRRRALRGDAVAERCRAARDGVRRDAAAGGWPAQRQRQPRAAAHCVRR